MNKSFFIYLSIVISASLFTYGLKALPIMHVHEHATTMQTKKIHLEVERSDVSVILKGLGKLPLEESGNLFLSIQQQAQEQMMPEIPKDTTHLKNKKK